MFLSIIALIGQWLFPFKIFILCFLFQIGSSVMTGAISNPNVFLSENLSNIRLRSETPSTVLPHPQQKAMSPTSPYIVGHHNDVAYHGENGHQYYSDNNNQADYSMSGNGCLNYLGIGNQMVHPAMQQSLQSYYPETGSPNSPEALANKTLTELNSLPPYSTENHEQVKFKLQKKKFCCKKNKKNSCKCFQIEFLLILADSSFWNGFIVCFQTGLKITQRLEKKICLD